MFLFLKCSLKQQANSWEKDCSTYYQQSPPHPEIKVKTSHWNPQVDIFTEFVRIDVCLRLIVLAVTTGHKHSQQIINYNNCLGNQLLLFGHLKLVSALIIFDNF